MQQNQNEEIIFETVHTTQGPSKNRTGRIRIETSVKGLVYRTNVYLNDFLVDAKEVSCIDLSALENAQSSFRDRYLATHTAFEIQYFIEKIFAQVLITSGNYTDGEGECSVVTSVFENIIKSEVIVDDYEVDVIETEIEDEIANDKKAFKLKYSKIHKELVKDNIDIPKFPVNTFLNKTLKRFPLYDRNPMYAFYIFMATVFLVLWIISLIVCGKAMPKLVKGIAGKEAGLVVKDLQKSMCIRSKKEDNTETKELIYDKLYKDGYLVLPQDIEFQDNNQIKTVYIKNTLDGDLIVKVNNKVIDNLNNNRITADMLIKILTPKNIIIKAGEIGQYEFKIEKSFLKSSSMEEGTYTGRLILEVIKVRYNTIQIVPVNFSFKVIKAVPNDKGK